jgi:hypothetical protein
VKNLTERLTNADAKAEDCVGHDNTAIFRRKKVELIKNIMLDSDHYHISSLFVVIT